MEDDYELATAANIKLEGAEVTLVSCARYVSVSDGEKENIWGADGGRVRTDEAGDGDLIPSELTECGQHAMRIVLFGCE